MTLQNTTFPYQVDYNVEFTDSTMNLENLYLLIYYVIATKKYGKVGIILFYGPTRRIVTLGSYINRCEDFSIIGSSLFAKSLITTITYYIEAYDIVEVDPESLHTIKDSYLVVRYLR